jgi:hypothetical protein
MVSSCWSKLNLYLALCSDLRDDFGQQNMESESPITSISEYNLIEATF